MVTWSLTINHKTNNLRDPHSRVPDKRPSHLSQTLLPQYTSASLVLSSRTGYTWRLPSFLASRRKRSKKAQRRTQTSTNSVRDGSKVSLQLKDTGSKCILEENRVVETWSELVSKSRRNISIFKS